jgi:hypothetical protein
MVHDKDTFEANGVFQQMTKLTVSYDKFCLSFLNASIGKGITPYTRTLSGTFNFMSFFQKTLTGISI